MIDYPNTELLSTAHEGVIIECKQSTTEFAKNSVRSCEVTTLSYSVYPQEQEQENQAVKQQNLEDLVGCDACFYHYTITDPEFSAWEQIFTYNDAKNWVESNYEGSCPDSVKAYAKIHEVEDEKCIADAIIESKEIWFNKINKVNSMVLNDNE